MQQLNSNHFMAATDTGYRLSRNYRVKRYTNNQSNKTPKAKTTCSLFRFPFPFFFKTMVKSIIYALIKVGIAIQPTYEYLN
ncbi:hypothetical protein MUGA111182_10275 [Mucilaginibacter galii]